MSCQQCEMLRINGRLCHETGCPIGSQPHIYINCEGPDGMVGMMHTVERWSERDNVSISIMCNGESVYSWEDQEAFDLVEWVCGSKDDDILEYWESIGCPEN